MGNNTADVSMMLNSFIAETTFDKLPAPVVERVKKSILDVIGCGVYGSSFEAVKPALAYAKAHPAAGEATIIAGGGKTSAFNAALVNGTYVHSPELAEGFTRAMVHPGNAIVPGVLAMAEREKRSGKDIIAGVAVGYELDIRFGLATGPQKAQIGFASQRRLHGPAVLGTLGAGAAVAKLMGYDLDRATDVMGVTACHVPTCLSAGIRQQATIKDVFQGMSSAMAILSADLVSTGITGLKNWVQPWFETIYPGIHDLKPIGDRLGEYWWTSSGGLRIKTRPVMGMCQPTMGAMYDLLAKERFDFREIEDVLVESSGRVEIGNLYDVSHIVSARFSIPFLTAATLVHQDAFVSDFYMLKFLKPELLTDPDVLALIKKVRLKENPEFTHNLEYAPPSGDPSHFMKMEARITVKMRDGSVKVSYADMFAKGTGAMSRDQVADKFRSATDGILPQKRKEEIIDTVWNLDAVDNVDQLIALIAEW